MSVLPVIAVTLGEPAGIGPEIALRAAWELRHFVHSVLIGDWYLLEKLASGIDKNMRLKRLQKEDLAHIRLACHTGRLVVLDCPLSRPACPGRPDASNAAAIMEGLELAIHGITEKHFDAMATAPIQKSIINDAGISFTGHTEYLAEKTRTDQVVMLLAGKVNAAANGPSRLLRVALATTHLSIRHVPSAINTDSLTGIIRILHQELQEKFGIAAPRILVSGLNPHAGENGYLGTEETDIIEPVIRSMQAEGICVNGPLSADTLFLPHHLARADCFLVMYHDQGLPVLKYATFGRGVNITLGLPFIRTSADHGTALDIAAQGVGLADYGSMTEAIRMAADMSLQQRRE